MRVAFAVVISALLALAGCATIENPLSQQDIAALKLTRVDVKYTPNAVINWYDAEQEYAAKVQPGLRERGPQSDPVGNLANQTEDPYQKAVKSPEGQEYVRNKVTAGVKDRVQRQLMPKLAAGNREVTLDVQIVNFTIPSTAQRVIIGGTPLLGAMVYLRDAKTGAQLAKFDQIAAAGAGNGVVGVLVDKAINDTDPSDRVFDQWIANVEKWLLKKVA